MKQKKHKKNAAKSLFQEWSSQNENCLIGCSHDCKYCYAKADAIRFKRTTPQQWKNEVVRTQMLHKRFTKKSGRIMFPSSHDITPPHLFECLTFLEHILRPGNEVLIVSKPHLDCVKAICGELAGYKEQVLFRFTIGSSDSATLKFWEPNSPDFAERLESLKYAFSEGYQTSVSCEPMLDDNVGDVISQVSPFVTDTIWLGTMYSPIARLKLNGELTPATKKLADELIKKQSDEFIRNLYSQHGGKPQIRWKGVIKKVLGL